MFFSACFICTTATSNENAKEFSICCIENRLTINVNLLGKVYLNVYIFYSFDFKLIWFLYDMGFPAPTNYFTWFGPIVKQTLKM